jgi:hypothetical protein
MQTLAQKTKDQSPEAVFRVLAPRQRPEGRRLDPDDSWLHATLLPACRQVVHYLPLVYLSCPHHSWLLYSLLPAIDLVDLDCEDITGFLRWSFDTLDVATVQGPGLSFKLATRTTGIHTTHLRSWTPTQTQTQTHNLLGVTVQSAQIITMGIFEKLQARMYLSYSLHHVSDFS